MFKEFLVPVEEITFEESTSSKKWSKRQSALFSVDRLFSLHKQDDNSWIWKLTVIGQNKHFQVIPSQDSFSSWLKARNDVIGKLSKKYPHITFNPKVRRIDATYQCKTQKYLMPLIIVKEENNLWRMSFTSNLYQPIWLPPYGNKPSQELSKAHTRKQLVVTVHNYIQNNLEYLYTKYKEDYIQERTLLLKLGKIKDFRYWWTSFVKPEINLQNIF